MEFKHSPAPWLTSRRECHVGSIATIHGCENNDWIEIRSTNRHGESVQEANARLIAAAPELLEALIDIRKLVEYHDKADLAIAKALGQQ